MTHNNKPSSSSLSTNRLIDSRLIDSAAIIKSSNDESIEPLVHTFLNTLPTNSLSSLPQGLSIVKFINGCNLACPMPLLKTKVALRDLPSHQALYVVATDPHSQADIAAFCHQSEHNLVLCEASQPNDTDQTSHELEKLDTIFHFIITKTDSN